MDSKANPPAQVLVMTNGQKKFDVICVWPLGVSHKGCNYQELHGFSSSAFPEKAETLKCLKRLRNKVIVCVME